MRSRISRTGLLFAFGVAVSVGRPLPAQQGTDSDPLRLRTGWKYYYDSTIPNPDTLVHDYFLQESIKSTRLPSGKVKSVILWTKALSVPAVGKYYLPKDAIERSARKLAIGYSPPFSAIKKLNREQTTDVIILEEAADAGAIQPEIKVMMEIDCEQAMDRTLSIVVTHGGRFGSSDKTGAWQHIAPESAVAGLSKIVCQ